MDKREYERQVRSLVNAGRLKFSQHVLRDHPERDITPLEVRECILRGTLQSMPVLTIKGDWKAEFFRHAAGQGLTVVVALQVETRVVVVTAY